MTETYAPVSSATNCFVVACEVSLEDSGTLCPTTPTTTLILRYFTIIIVILFIISPPPPKHQSQ